MVCQESFISPLTEAVSPICSYQHIAFYYLAVLEDQSRFFAILLNSSSFHSPPDIDVSRQQLQKFLFIGTNDWSQRR
jgi:hypothetical protein